MKKVTIVGVEGSGKTVLMAAMGDKYKSPDVNGVFLKPENRETYSYYTKEAAKLRGGKWPLVTSAETVLNLEWVLSQRKSDNQTPREICHLSFLDYGGEVYRLAFGGGRESERHGLFKDAITSLRSHVLNSDILIVLVNMSDIINGSDEAENTIETKWLSQAILSLAFENGARKNVALVFTQADSYVETITANGGLNEILSKYLPEVYVGYSSRISLFAVSAVNKTIPDSDGSWLQVPAPDFASDGFEELVKWISDSATRVKDVPNEEVPQIEKKRGFIYWAGRLFLCGLIAGSCLLGWAFGWEPIYWEYFYLFSEVEKCRKCAWEALDALNGNDIEKFKVCVEMPQGIENWVGDDKTISAQDFAKKRGQFWDVCKRMSKHDGYWSTHYYLPARREVVSGFTCSLFGEKTSVFAFSGLSNGKSSYSDNDLLIALCVRKQDNQNKTVWFDFRKGEQSK